METEYCPTKLHIRNGPVQSESQTIMSFININLNDGFVLAEIVNSALKVKGTQF